MLEYHKIFNQPTYNYGFFLRDVLDKLIKAHKLKVSVSNLPSEHLADFLISDATADSTNVYVCTTTRKGYLTSSLVVNLGTSEDVTHSAVNKGVMQLSGIEIKKFISGFKRAYQMFKLYVKKQGIEFKDDRVLVTIKTEPKKCYVLLKHYYYGQNDGNLCKEYTAVFSIVDYTTKMIYNELSRSKSLNESTKPRYLKSVGYAKLNESFKDILKGLVRDIANEFTSDPEIMDLYGELKDYKNELKQYVISQLKDEYNCSKADIMRQMPEIKKILKAFE